MANLIANILKKLQSGDATILKECQEFDATSLKYEQELAADDLLNGLLYKDADSDKYFRTHAARALKKSQEKAATALRESQADDAALLKKTQETSAEQMDEKDQVISWLTGGYSVENDREI